MQRLLGSLNYLAKFGPHLSNIMQPLRRLLDKDTEWSWLHTHQQAFDEMKKALTMTPALSYYDVIKPVVIQCDTSDNGLGAALLQNGLPVAYSSRALTSAETKEMSKYDPLALRRSYTIALFARTSNMLQLYGPLMR